MDEPGDIRIRPERDEDAGAVRRLNLAAFDGPGEAAIVDRLRAAGRIVLSLVAVAGERVVGHIVFSPVTIDGGDRSHEALGLAPMAVLPELQRRGIGSRLVREGLRRCAEAGHRRVVLVGHPEYYPRFGFEPGARFGVRYEYDVPDEAFMVLALVEGALDDCGGVARYARELYEGD